MHSDALKHHGDKFLCLVTFAQLHDLLRRGHFNFTICGKKTLMPSGKDTGLGTMQ